MLTARSETRDVPVYLDGLGTVQAFNLVSVRPMVEGPLVEVRFREGQDVQAGERFGIIRFGSRTDVYLPDGVRPLVAEGQTMIGGETVIAELAPGRAPGAQAPAAPV